MMIDDDDDDGDDDDDDDDDSDDLYGEGLRSGGERGVGLSSKLSVDHVLAPSQTASRQMP